jgi:hypothetical protein
MWIFFGGGLPIGRSGANAKFGKATEIQGSRERCGETRPSEGGTASLSSDSGATHVEFDFLGKPFGSGNVNTRLKEV